ncbi:DUF4282 domain-containing protein [Thiorhodococcus mannitoliphagus]|uniref:DUF4282 domain-containing protein n=1 Tax=Thiorhodococcus mannitoliphagus TaxID=329406 RepID=A0A6P1E1W5_9GAMM|nr:DUF4282 domain-containing protein [Thiorhodococcus mannitoliphagus]NEX23203.1 DUF4282 domain-containing protein [Thiorhodococcus mannitoliphagus]
MKRLVLHVPLFALAGSGAVWAAPAFSDASMGDVIPYVVIIFAFLGMSVGAIAGVKRGFNVFATGIGGFFLGPLAFVLFLVPRAKRVKRQKEADQCPFCRESMAPGAKVCGNCGWDPAKKKGISEPQREAAIQADSEPRRRRSRSKSKSPSTAKRDASNNLSSEFAQYSEMLRQTLPGTLNRPKDIDYMAKFSKKDEGIHCANPACQRMLLPPYEKCPHCGTVQIRGAA